MTFFIAALPLPHITSKAMKRTLLVLAVCAAASLPAHAVTLFGITDDNRLVSFDTANPSTFLTSTAVTGLKASNGATNDPNAVLVNFARNTDTGGYYGVDTNANFYSISTSGAATLVNNTFSPNGYSAGFAYDPFTQKFLFASDAAENVLIATNGTRTTNPALMYGFGDANELSTPAVFAAGIDADFGTSFFIDAELDILSQSFDPSFGELFTVGSLGLDVVSFGGLVVDADGLLWASLSTDGITSSLYSINATTGAATLVGSFGGVGMHSIAQVPEPSRALLLGIACAGLVFRRRRKA